MVGGEVRMVLPVDFRPDYRERSFGMQTIGDFFLAMSLYRSMIWCYRPSFKIGDLDRFLKLILLEPRLDGSVIKRLPSFKSFLAVTEGTSLSLSFLLDTPREHG